MHRLFERRHLVGAFAALALLSACGGAGHPTAAAVDVSKLSPAERTLVEAARKEGKVVLYSGSEESIIAKLGETFRAKYGIPLEYQRLQSSEIAMRYTAEVQAGKTVADVLLTGDHEIFEQFGAKGWIAKSDAAAVPGLDVWPAEFRDDVSTVVSIFPYGIAINTDLVKVPPKDWAFLHDPALKGQMVALDAKRVNLVAIAGWDFLLTKYGDDFLRKVGDQQLRLVDSQPSEVQQVSAGAAKAYFPAGATQVEAAKKQGAPITSVVPEGLPYTGVLTRVAVSAKSPHPNAAKLFAAFLLTPEGQKILNVVASSPVATPGTPPLAPGFVKPDFASTAKNKAKIVELLRM